MARAFFTEKAPLPVGPYSQAVEARGTLYLSGQIGIDPATGKLRKGFGDQVRQIFSRFGEFNSLYAEFFEDVDPKPARVTVGVRELPLSAEVEVEIVAVRG